MSDEKSNQVLLIDALGVVYRAYYAIPALSTHAGVPTNALLGFIKTVSQLRHVWNPSHCAIVFDGGTPPARRELLPEYKAQRPPMPHAMREQLPLIENYLACAGLAAVRRDLNEADDILAALSSRAESSGMEALVVTSDKDLMQIVTDHVVLLTPGKVDQRADPDAVVSRTGVAPAQIVDWLALIGDSSDNIPGVPGVGPKTATRWLAQYGSIDGILENLPELMPEKSRLALAQNPELVRRNVELVRLQVDLPDLPQLEDLRIKTPDYARLLEFYRTYEFHALERELSAPTLF